MSERPFDTVRRALRDISQEPAPQAETTLRIRLDPTRQARTGIPEIVYGRTKPAADVIGALRELASATGRAIAARCPMDTLAVVDMDLSAQFEVIIEQEAMAVVVARRDCPRPDKGGRIAVVTGGSSDAAIAAETALVAREMGAQVYEVRDVGVAGLHRLVQPLERVIESSVDAIVVVAGMDGALPSVIAGLVAVPVIGVPASTGYGFGGDGTAALMAMLQSCAPGLVVVNIDNGVGAGSTAALIANRAAAARSSSPHVS